LSIGTLQLSIRCSSIHFRPSRSLPVSDGDVLVGAAWFDCVPCANADSAHPMVRNELSNAADEDRMMASQIIRWNEVPLAVSD
jgi:hypothetical protein